MNLGDLLETVDHLAEDATVFARPPWSCETEAIAAVEGDANAVAATDTGMIYLLEVALIRDVLETWSEWRDGRVPSRDERCDAVIHYATHDAYLAL
jgi:hypothetical protein